MSEHLEQCAYFEWVNLNKSIAPFIFATPNGGMRDIRVAKKLKKEGVKAGVYDVFVAIPSSGFHGLWIEFKFGKNNLTKQQKEFRKNMELVQYKTIVCFNSLEAINQTKEYLRMAADSTA